MCFDPSVENLVVYQDNTRADNFLYSHHLSAWKCIDTVRRNNLSITLRTGSEYVFQKPSTKIPLCCLFPNKSLVNPRKIQNWI